MAKSKGTGFRQIIVLGAGAIGSYYGAILSSGVPNKENAKDSLYEARRRYIDECVGVVKGEVVALDPSIAEEVNSTLALYSNRSSMCQDIIKGKRTEIDFLNNKISELGKHGVPTPVNDTLTALIRFMEGRKWT